MKKLIAVLALAALAAYGSDEPGSTQNSVTPENNAAEATTPAAPVDSSTTAAPAGH